MNFDKFFTTLWITTIAGMVLVINPAKGQAECPNGEDYQPCTCSPSSGYSRITCTEIPLDEVSNVFKRTTPSPLASVFLYLKPDPSLSIDIPADLLSNHNVLYTIDLKCPNTSDHQIGIHPNAFLSSKDMSSRVVVNYCDVRRLNFHFLAGFNSFIRLEFYRSTNIHLADWASMPPLSNLTDLDISFSVGLNEWTTFPRLMNGLSYLILSSNGIVDVAMDRILNWAVAYSSNTLEALFINDNDLTMVPRQFSSLSKLQNLHFYYQRTGIPLATSGSFNFTAPNPLILGDNNKIETIEPGAFQGNFTSARITLSDNNLRRFEEGVFKGVLQQQVDSPNGYLDVARNAIDCSDDPCHLAWIIRDNRQLLFRTHLSASCSNGTSFMNLDPNAYSLCP